MDDGQYGRTIPARMTEDNRSLHTQWIFADTLASILQPDASGKMRSVESSQEDCRAALGGQTINHSKA